MEDHGIMQENGTQRAVTQPHSFLCYNQPVSLASTPAAPWTECGGQILKDFSVPHS